MKPLLIDAPADAEKQTAPGGQLMITTDVENYPGFSEGIDGPELMHEFRKQAERFGTEFMEAWITEVDLSERPFQLYTRTHTISAETLIIATGASAKWLGIPGEAKVPDGFGGNGVSACATCDGPLPCFSKQGAGRGRRRRYGDGRGDVPDAYRSESLCGSSSRQVASVEDHAGEGVSKREDRVYLGF
jgi:hypothetical protein